MCRGGREGGRARQRGRVCERVPALHISRAGEWCREESYGHVYFCREGSIEYDEDWW